MRFALIQEGDFAEGEDISRRYREMATEAICAEKMGFETYCLSEQHFLKETCTVSCPEVYLADIAARTTRLRLRVTSAVLLAFNHPIRIAERLTTLDMLSNGRAELGTARSNNLHTLEAFGINPSESRAQWNEAMDIVIKVLTQDPFEHNGPLWTIPPRTLTPPSVQKPHPPILVSATSFETHENAGRRGIGVMTGNSILGWDYAERCIGFYQKGNAKVAPAAGSYVNNHVGFFVAVAHCADEMARARRQAARVTRIFIDFVIWLFSRIGASSPEYAYFTQIRKIEERKDDLDYVIESAPYFMIGSPDYLIERLRRLERMGVHEVILRIDGMGHELNMQSIEAFGTKVIPAFRTGPSAPP